MKSTLYSKLSILLILSLFVQLVLSFLSIPQAEASHADLSESEFYEYVSSLNQSLFNGGGKKVSYQTYLTYGVIAYGSSSDVSSNDYRKATKVLGPHCQSGRYEYRYLGQTITNSSFANGCFPPDEVTGADLSGKTWVTIDSSESSWVSVRSTAQREQLQYTRLIGSSTDPEFTLKSVGGRQYGLVQAAPTLCSQGSVKMNHRDSTNKLWYAVFEIEKLGDCAGSIGAKITTPQDQDTYTIDSTSDEITISNIVVTADVQWKGYFNNPTYVSSLKASLTNNNASAATTKQKTVTATTSIKVKRSDFALNQTTKTITLTGNAELKAFGDTVSAVATKTITINAEPVGPDPYVTSTCSCSPSSVQFTGADVPVSVPLSAEVKNMTNEANIDHWVVYGRTESGEQYTTKTYTPTTNKKVVQHTFNFSIPASKVTGESYTENFVVRARVYFKNGTYSDFTYKDMAVSCTTIVAKNPPAVVIPPPVVDDNLPPIPIIVAPDSSPAGDVYVSGQGSYDPEDGTNLAYQWYSCKMSGSLCGGLTAAHATRDGYIQFLSVGEYYIYLGVTDTEGKSSSTYKSITITQPLPTAAITTTGQLKEKRPIKLDGSSSSSPSLYPINDSLSRWTITSLSGTASDVVTIGSLNGTKVLDVMFQTEGEYQVTYTVTNSLGLSNTKSTVLNIELDSSPIASLDTSPKLYRDPDRDNHAFIEIESEAYSADGDLIGSHDLRMVYDSDNDGDYADESNERIIALDTITGKASVEVTFVGKYRFMYIVKETFDTDPFGAYIVAADYLSSGTYTAYVEVDNQAPFTSLSPQRQYSADLYLDFGDISDESRQSITNQIPDIQAQLAGNRIETEIQTGEWDPEVEPYFLKDAGYKLNHDVTWSTGFDARYYLAFTETLGNGLSSEGDIQTLDLKKLPITTTPFEGDITSAVIAPNNTLYLSYKNPINTNSYQYYTATIPGVRGTATKAYTGYSFISTDGRQYEGGTWATDSNGYPYMVIERPVYDGSPFYREYWVRSISMGNFQMVSNTNYMQRYSKPSLINGAWTMWSTSGLFWIDTWQQDQNFWRKSTNAYNPTQSPDYYGNTGYHLYREGYTVGANSYWIGQTGTQATNYFAIKYNTGGLQANTSVYNYRLAFVEGNSLIVIVTKNDLNMYKLTYTNGVLVGDQLLDGLRSQTSYFKYNATTKKLYGWESSYDYVKLKSRQKVSEYDLVLNKLNWSKLTPFDVNIVDIGFTPEGEPKYLWRDSSDYLNYYYSLDSDPEMPPATIKSLRTVSAEVNTTVSYNSSGMYAWYSKEKAYGSESASYTPGRIVKVYVVDAEGEYSEKVFSGKDGVILDDLLVTEEGDVWVVGQNRNGLFTARMSEDYAFKLTSFSFPGTPGGRNGDLIQEKDGTIYLFRKAAPSTPVYRYDEPTSQFVLATTTSATTSLLANTRIVNNTVRTMDLTYRQVGSEYYYTYAISGDQIVDMSQTSRVFTTSMDIDEVGDYFGVVNVQDYSSGTSYWNTYVRSNHSNFELMGAVPINTFYNYVRVRVKFIANKPYMYAQKTYTSNIEVYLVERSISGTYKFTSVGTVVAPNLNNITWIGDTFDVMSGLQTTSQAPKAFDSVPNYSLYYEKNAATDLLTARNGINTHYDTFYDSDIGGFFAAHWLGSEIQAVLYDPITKTQVLKHSLPFAAPTYARSIGYANGNIYYATTLYDTVSAEMRSLSVYKISTTGTSLLKTINTTAHIQFVYVKQDEDGHTYIAYSVRSSDTYNLRFADNHTGVWRDQLIAPAKSTPYNVDNMEVVGGKFYLIPNSLNPVSANKIYYGSVSTPTVLSSYKPSSPSLEVSSIYNVQIINGNISFIATRYNTTTNSYIRVLYSQGIGIIDGISDYTLDDYHLYLTGTSRYYMLDIDDYELLDAGPGGKFIFKGNGKAVSWIYDGGVAKPFAAVSNGVNLGIADPDFMNTLVRDDVIPVFIGTDLRSATEDIVQATFGTNIDLTTDTEDAVVQAIDFMDTDVKETDSSIPSYYLEDMPITFAEEFFDLESDPKQQGRWKFSHTPAVFDNPQGQIVDHGQYRSTPYASFDRVGRYEVIFEAQDNPGVVSYRKWSEQEDGTIFYVHRKPVAYFSFSLRESISSLGQVDIPIVEDSYDLDHSISMPSKGIVEKRWRWKEEGDTEWQDEEPPASFPMNRIYWISLTVVDIEGAESDPVTQIVDTSSFIPNSPPTVTVTQPSSSSSSTPTVLNSLRPTFTWMYTDVDSHAQQKYELEVYRQSTGVRVYTSTQVTSSLKTFTMPSNLLENVTYYVQVKAFDGLSWSVSWSSRKYFTISLNSPPVANFDWSPKPVWEGDTVTLTNQSSDPDGDALTYIWSISGPVNYLQTALTTHVSRKFTQPGDYTVKLTVSDGQAQTILTRTLRVEPLFLEAGVTYTDLWLEHHLQMGHETVLNPKSFYTGEIFVVSAIGSLAATSRVTASLDAIGRDGNPISISVDLVVSDQANHYLGNLYDPILSSLTGGLPEGQHQIKFKMTYTNGVVKEISIPIQIIGHVQGAVNVHRRQ